MKVGILGYGRFGRALGDLLLEADVDVRALDPFAEVPEGRRAETLAALARGADVVVVAVPVPRIRAALEDLRPHLAGDTIVVDVGSVKTAPMQAMNEVLGDAVPFVASHPLFGPLSLALAERPLRVVLCPSPRHPAAAATVKALYERIGCEVVEQTAEGHDRVMAHTHALTFFVAKGMIDAGAGMSVPFAPASFQAFSRTIETVRSDAGHLFSAIQRENPFAAEARKHLLEALGAIDAALDVPADDAPPDSTRFSIPDLGERSPALRQTREHIDALDRELVALLARRADLARRAAKAKAEIGAPVLDAAREASILEARRKWAEDVGLDAASVDEIFRAVMRSSRRSQR